MHREPATRIEWKERTFVGFDEPIPYPSVTISSDAIDALGLFASAHNILAHLVSDRVFSACGYSAPAADPTTNLLPMRLRSEAKSVINKANDLVSAIERFDRISDGLAEALFKHSAVKDLVADYSYWIPTRPAEKRLLNVSFACAIRDQIFLPEHFAVSDQPVLEVKFNKAGLIKFLSTLDHHVLLPLNQCLKHLKHEDIPVRLSKEKSIAVDIAKGDRKVLERIVYRDLANLDKEQRAASDFWEKFQSRRET